MSIMDRQNRSKLNQLFELWPANTVAAYIWLKRQNISRQLVNTYKKGGWLKSVGRGAFVRFNEEVDWTSALYALQEQLHLPIHAGGKTALQLKGYAHFLSLGNRSQVFLFGSRTTKLPAWFQQRDWGAGIEYFMTNLFPEKMADELTKHDMGSYSISISIPERAIMEVLYLVPNRQTFEEAGLLMEGLTTLRPKLVSELLERCNSIKVKRLFLFLAEYYRHAWFDKLDLSKVYLGVGKRLVVKDGCFESKYKITIPESFRKEQEEVHT
jgi:hypothetical protein